MPDLRHWAKRAALMLRQFLRRADVVERHLRGQGLEIGALQDPQWLPPGAVASYVDCADTATLRRQYPRKARRRLVEVDIVADGERLQPVADGSQDFVIANHFLEHCEDPVGALRHMLRVLRPGGVVYLSVPDKRHTFDRDRPATTVAHLLADHQDGPAAARRGHYEEVVRHGEHVRDEAAVAARVQELMAQGFRIHFHSWTLDEFLALLVALRQQGLLAAELLELRANEHEFVVVLRKPAAVAAAAAPRPAPALAR